MNHERFDPNLPTVLYLHGYLENMEVESSHVIADAYLKRNDHNTLLLDWAELADGNYLFDSVPNIKKVGTGFMLMTRSGEGEFLSRFINLDSKWPDDFYI